MYIFKYNYIAGEKNCKYIINYNTEYMSFTQRR